MFQCRICKKIKGPDQFHKDKSRRTGLQTACKPCNIARVKKYYHTRHYKYKPAYSAKAKAYRKELQSRVNEMKRNQGCLFCGEREPVCLDYHHKDPSTKLKPVARLVISKNWDKVMSEISKCIVLCSNCHRKFHAGLITLPRT